MRGGGGRIVLSVGERKTTAPYPRILDTPSDSYYEFRHTPLTSEEPGITDGLVGVGHPRNAPDEHTLSFLRGLFAVGGLFYNSGSAALGLAYVAAGRLVGFFESDLRVWDALAGEVLIRESGGWSTSFMHDGSLTTPKPVLAANRGSASALRDLAGDVLEGCSSPDQDDGL